MGFKCHKMMLITWSAVRYWPVFHGHLPVHMMTGPGMKDGETAALAPGSNSTLDGGL